MYCLVVNGASYYSPFKSLGLKLKTDPSVLDTIPHLISLVVFTGGEDVSPHLYGHERTLAFCNDARDAVEVEIYKKAKSLKIPMVGICRGAQLLCVMAGGTLVQDITGHNSNHKLSFVDENGNVNISPSEVTSSHHQMQYPFNLPKDDFDVLGWSPKPLSSHYLYNGETIGLDCADKKFTMEPDVVHYKTINAVGFQFHPEWMSEDSWGVKYTQRIVKEKLLSV